MRWTFCRECKNPRPADEAAEENDRRNPSEFSCRCEKHETGAPQRAPYVLGELKPYRNVIDGKMISSRREHREFLKRNNVRECPDAPAALKERLYEQKHGAKHG